MFCCSSMFASEVENLNSNETQNKYHILQAKLVKNLEPIDIMIELKFIKAMVGFYISAIMFNQANYLPNNWAGFLGRILIGFGIGLVPFRMALYSLLEGGLFCRYKWEKDKDSLLNMQNEQVAIATEEQSLVEII